MSGRVILVGAGPGDPDLITVAGLKALREADVIVTDRLVPLSLLDQARDDADIIEVGKIPRGEFTPQQRINEILVEHATQGKTVVRFKGGDPFVFGRGFEEHLACQEAGLEVTYIPGISSSIAGAGLAGIPITHRGLTQGFTVVSGHVPPTDERSDIDWDHLATTGLSLVIMMGVLYLPQITTRLIAAGLNPELPAAIVENAALPTMRVIRGTAADIAQRAIDEQIRPPAVTIIGKVAGEILG